MNINSVTVRKKTTSAKRPDGEKKESAKRSLTPIRLGQKFGIWSKKEQLNDFEKFELKQQFLDKTEVSVNSDETSATETPKNRSSLIVSPPDPSDKTITSATKDT
jgi:hypothetical protein